MDRKDAIDTQNDWDKQEMSSLRDTFKTVVEELVPADIRILVHPDGGTYEKDISKHRREQAVDALIQAVEASRPEKCKPAGLYSVGYNAALADMRKVNNEA